MNEEDIRREFEQAVQSLRTEVGRAVRLPLTASINNGEFARYVNPDTDAAWFGFKLGFQAGFKHGTEKAPF